MKRLFLLLLAVGSLHAQPYNHTIFVRNTATVSIDISWYRNPEDWDDGWDAAIVANRITVDAGQTVGFVASHPEQEGTTNVIGFVNSDNLVGNSYLAGGAESQFPIGSLGTIGNDEITYVINTTGRLPNPDESKTLWMVDGIDLTADIFREGVDKIIAYSGSGSSSSGSGMTLEEFAGTNTEDVAALQKNYYDNPKSAPAFNDDGAGAAAKEQTELAFSDRDTPSVGTAPSASNTGMVLRLPIAAGGDISYDPEDYPWLKSWASWFKASIAWLITILFQIWLWNYFKETYYTLAGTQQAKGNPIVGGTGAQATSLVAALLITAVIVSLPSLFWAMADSGLGWSATISVNPATLATGQQFLNVGLYIFTYFFPLGTALAALSSYFVILRGGLILIAGMQSLIRFFVP